jgi:tetratricopeptide (TPR) repeat protein
MKSLALLLVLAAPLAAQRGPSGPMQEATRLDLAGETSKARTIIQGIIDTSSQPAGKAAAQRAMAMSYAFDGDCNNAIRYERMVIDYWKTREQAEPQNAFYQQGEMANEAARVCIDVGALDSADVYYKLGTQLGIKEPMPATHPRALWDYRIAHALGRLAARRGNKAEAQRQIANARKALDSDSTMRAGQERFFPYLVGYVALYTGDLATAERELTNAVNLQGNQNDPFMRLLLGMTHEKLGHAAAANTEYEKALSLATGHNPPSAYVHHFMNQRTKK